MNVILKGVFALALVIGFFWKGIAFGVPIQVNDSIADNTFVAVGGILSGSFNISSVLPPQGLESATVTFRFSDDNDVTLRHNLTTHYLCFGSNCFRASVDFFHDAPEKVLVDVEGQMRSGNTSPYSDFTFTDQSFDGFWPIYAGYHKHSFHFYTYSFASTSGSKENFGFSFGLGPNQLASLADEGFLNFSVKATSGDLFLNFAQLEAIPNELVAAAPEPGTLLLMGSGLAGLRLFCRRKRSR